LSDAEARVFAALADPTRRGLLDRLARQGPLTATELAVDAPITRQAIALHLGSLAEAGLVHGDRQGREVRYAVAADGLDGAVAWLQRVGARWDHRLEALRREVDRRRG
jgi:DNA-binding transcriptional ArsR family regulator